MAHFTDGTNDFTADKALSKATTPKVLMQVFGDGYEQRLKKGINSLGETFSVSFSTREKAEVKNIAIFFEDKAAATSFVFAPPHLGSKTATTSFSGKTITSSGLSASVLSPSTPTHILVTGSTNNDNGYTLNRASTISNTVLTVTDTLTSESNTASVVIQAGVAVVCDSWNQTYDYDDYYSISGNFRRVYEI